MALQTQDKTRHASKQAPDHVKVEAAILLNRNRFSWIALSLVDCTATVSKGFILRATGAGHNDDNLFLYVLQDGTPIRQFCAVVFYTVP